MPWLLPRVALPILALPAPQLLFLTPPDKKVHTPYRETLAGARNSPDRDDVLLPDHADTSALEPGQSKPLLYQPYLQTLCELPHSPQPIHGLRSASLAEGVSALEG